MFRCYQRTKSKYHPESISFRCNENYESKRFSFKGRDRLLVWFRFVVFTLSGSFESTLKNWMYANSVEETVDIVGAWNHRLQCLLHLFVESEHVKTTSKLIRMKHPLDGSGENISIIIVLAKRQKTVARCKKRTGGSEAEKKMLNDLASIGEII